MKLEDDFEKFCTAIKEKFKVEGIQVYTTDGAEIDSDSFCHIRLAQFFFNELLCQKNFNNPAPISNRVQPKLMKKKFR